MNHSRWCQPCETAWPLDTRFNKCPICDKPTSAHEDDHEFDSHTDAFKYAYAVKHRRELHARFEEYYLNVHIPAGANKVLQAIKDAAELTEAELAEQFAKLMEKH